MLMERNEESTSAATRRRREGSRYRAGTGMETDEKRGDTPEKSGKNKRIKVVLQSKGKQPVDHVCPKKHGPAC